MNGKKVNKQTFFLEEWLSGPDLKTGYEKIIMRMLHVVCAIKYLRYQLLPICFN